MTGTAAEVTSALNNLVFTPTVSDQPEHTVFDISVVDSAGDTALNRITTVVVAHPVTIATNSVTTLASVENAFIVENLTGSVVSFLKLNGSVVTEGQFPAGWTPVGAVQTGSGYEVAFSAPDRNQPGQNQYVVWNVDSNGNYISNATGTLSGRQTRNSRGCKPSSANSATMPNSWRQAVATATPIVSSATTTLAELEVGGLSQNGDAYELNPPGGREDRCLSSMAALSPRASSRPVGRRSARYRRETGTKSPSVTAGTYVVWNIDSNGDYTSNATGTLSGASLELAEWKPPSATGPSLAPE